MLWELEEACFEVVLIPAQEQKHSGHCIRALQSGNPKWYTNFAAEYQSITGRGRKRKRVATTFIKKANTVSALSRLLRGKDAGIYAERLLEFTRRQLANRKPEIIPEEQETVYFEIGGKRVLCPF